ncbi:MAG: tetratricopeptide repeat protein [Anaerolineae bacterium]
MTRDRGGLDLASSHQLRGRIADLINLKKYEKAIEEARRGIAHEPEDAELHGLLAWALCMHGEVDAAEQPARRALALAPGDADAHSTLGLVLLAMGRPEEARPHHEGAVALRPTSADFHARVAACYLEEGNWEATVEKADDALRFNPRLVQALALKGSALHKLRDLDQAEAVLKEALAIEPRRADLHGRIGHVYMLRGELQEAFHHLRYAVRLDPTDEKHRMNLARVRLLGVPGVKLLVQIVTDRRRLAIFTAAGSLVSALVCQGLVAVFEPRVRYLGLGAACLFPLAFLLGFDVLLRVVKALDRLPRRL